MTECGARSRQAFLKYEEDQEGDGEAEKAGRFGEREAEKRKGLYLALGGRVAGDRVYQRREHIADADTGSDERNAGKAGPDHFGGSEIHSGFPLVEGEAKRF
jgi:hypothetical protein